MSRAHIGLLPLYLELYDRTMPDKRRVLGDFYGTIANELEKRGLEVSRAPVCRVRDEFEAAVRGFERAGADAIVTLHLAYSPSLESAEALATSPLPIVVLDTTPDAEFGPGVDPAAIMYNHGIHGVQDMCTLLIRRGKPFKIEAGHRENSDVLDRVVRWARAARASMNLRRARVGRIGPPFEGMGDFYVPPGVLKKTTGIEQVAGDPARIAALLPAADAPEVRTEVESDLKAFEVESVDSAAHVRTTRVCLATRRWIAQEGLSAFTMNFARIGRRSGLPTLPFLEASKAMARGIGYAGEGDVLTAATVGALASAYPETTFAEMFCPDWKGNRVFLSHMGEMNPALAAGRPRLVEQKYAFIDSDSTVLAVGRFRGGDAVMADVAPMGNERYRLIVAPVRMVDVEGDDKLRDSVRGWFSHGRGTAGFLEAYSRAGGTHHLALVYGAAADEIAAFGEFLGWEVVRIEAEP